MSDPKLRVGTAYCLCVPCGEYFVSPKGYTRHRVGRHPNRSCLAPNDMSETGFRRVTRGKYEYWAAP